MEDKSAVFHLYNGMDKNLSVSRLPRVRAVSYQNGIREHKFIARAQGRLKHIRVIAKCNRAQNPINYAEDMPKSDVVVECLFQTRILLSVIQGNSLFPAAKQHLSDVAI